MYVCDALLFSANKISKKTSTVHVYIVYNYQVISRIELSSRLKYWPFIGKPPPPNYNPKFFLYFSSVLQLDIFIPSTLVNIVGTHRHKKIKMEKKYGKYSSTRLRFTNSKL